MGLRLAGAAQRYSGDYGNPQLRLAAEASLHVQVSPASSFFATGGRGRLAAGRGGSSFDQAFDYAGAVPAPARPPHATWPTLKPPA